MIKKYSLFKENNHSKDDPYDEEDWDDRDVFDVGDTVICINNDDIPKLITQLEINKKYKIEKFVGNLLKLKDIDDKYLWSKKRFLRVTNENINHSKDDPYDEEDWTDENDWTVNRGFDEDIKYHDTVICLHSMFRNGKEVLKEGIDYMVIEVHPNGRMLCLQGVGNWWRKNLFRKQTPEDEYFGKFDEHIAYLEDDEPDELPKEDLFELLDVVSLPSGQYLQINRKLYNTQKNIISWSERLKSYVCRDKDMQHIELCKKFADTLPKTSDYNEYDYVFSR